MISGAESGIVHQRDSVDRNSGKSECCSADYVSSVVTGARVIHVPASPAGRDGFGQRGLGRAGKQSGSPLGAPLFFSGSGGRTVHGATLPAYVPGVTPCTRSGA